MNDLKDEWAFLATMIEVLAKHFGRNCEVVLHDYASQLIERLWRLKLVT